MSTVAQISPNVSFIRRVTRELTASPGEDQLTTSELDQTLNDIYATDFPYGIKVDQMRSVYAFYTRPYIDRYPLDVNYNQGVRSPVFIDGYKGYFSKDRSDFFNVWPYLPFKYTPIEGDGITASFSFNTPGTFLSKQVTLGGVAVDGNAITVNDDGNGNLQLQVPNPVVSVPPQNTNPAYPGMYNINTSSPGLNNPTNIGTVDYVSGNFALTFPSGFIPAAGTQMTLWVSPYQTGRPYSILFWNNEFTVRPVPKIIHKIEVETYLTPIQFMNSTDLPILNQWAKYLAYLTAAEILRRRQDMDGVAIVMEGAKRQEQLVLERQATEEINMRNRTIFSSSTPSQEGNNGYWQGGFF